MARRTAAQLRTYAIERLTDGATSAVILDELTAGKKYPTPGEALKAIDLAKELIARVLDEDDYQTIRGNAFAGDANWQKFYRERTKALGELQVELKTDKSLDTETRTRLILGCDRTIQGYCTLSLRGRRDLPVAFAPKGVLQNQTPPTDDDIDAGIDGSL